MCEPSQLTRLYKMNRNWGLLFLIAGKLNYREYIVTTRYNGTGNGKRDMHSERMSVMARKVKSQRYDCGQVHGESLNTSLIKTKPPISNGNPKSDYSDMEVFTEHKRF